MSRSKIDVVKIAHLSDAVTYLEGFVAAMKQGKIKLQKGEKELLLTPSDQVEIKLKAKTKKELEKFFLEISWTRPPAPGEDVEISPADVPEGDIADSEDSSLSEPAVADPSEPIAAPAAPVTPAISASSSKAQEPPEPPEEAS